MKKGIKILSFVLALAVVISTMSVVAFAEGTTLTGTIQKTNTVSGIVSTTFSKYTCTVPNVAVVFNNYETVPFGTYPASGNNNTGTLPLYASQMSSFKMPLYEAASAINLYVCVRVRNGDSKSTFPIYLANKAWPFADNLCGAYLDDSAAAVDGYTQDGTYTAFVTEANKYWNGGAAEGEDRYIQVGTTSGSDLRDGTSSTAARLGCVDVSAAIGSITSEDVIFATGKGKLGNSYIRTAIWGTLAPKLEVTYDETKLVNLLSGAADASELKKYVDALYSEGVIAAAEGDYSTKTDAEKLVICGRLLNATYSDWAGFETALATAVASSEAVKVVTLDSIVTTKYNATIEGVTYTDAQSAIIYGKAANVTEFGFIVKYLETTHNCQFKGKLAEDGSFAIRLVPAQDEEGNFCNIAGNYEATPYYVEDGTQTTTASATSFTIE